MLLNVKVRVVKEQLLLSCYSRALVSVKQLEHPCPNRHGDSHYDALTDTCNHGYNISSEVG